MRPRRTCLAVIALGLFVAACGSDTGATSDIGPGGIAENDGAAAEPVAEDATEPLVVEPNPVELIVVDQIAGDPRDGSVPSALRGDRFDSSFPDPLIDPDAIISGGPPPDGIPPIDEPRFEVASTVDWLADVEPVLLLDVDGEARAYPVQIMTWHEIVNDTFGSTPVTVSFCPLCNSAVAYERSAGDRVLDFGTSGELFNSSLVMYDRQTESLWSHFTGQAVVGALTGTDLTLIPMTTVSWATYRDAHPDGLVLSRETGFSRDYGRNPYVGYDDVANSPFLFRGETDGRLPPQTRVVAVRGDDGTVAVLHDLLVAEGAVTVDLDRETYVALHVSGTASALDTDRIRDGRDVGTTGVFRTRVGDVDVELSPSALSRSADGTFVDSATGSTFDVLGRAVDGPLAGEQLERVEHLDTFWFAIAAFEPDTTIISRP